ncbi:MAG: hypothetical protein KKE96_06930 [Candidatus Altiarchaeota archaeon]|nr:hypothetical protein [Candidatus Altiarchaeota archaeon]
MIQMEKLIIKNVEDLTPGDLAGVDELTGIELLNHLSMLNENDVYELKRTGIVPEDFELSDIDSKLLFYAKKIRIPIF